MSTGWWVDMTPEDWVEHLLSVGCQSDVVELEGLARWIAREPDNMAAQLYFEDILDRSASKDFELLAFIAFRDDERERLGGAG